MPEYVLIQTLPRCRRCLGCWSTMVVVDLGPSVQNQTAFRLAHCQLASLGQVPSSAVDYP